nr:MAG TPA: Nse4 C-terminal [Caudoviricetes sp.]
MSFQKTLSKMFHVEHLVKHLWNIFIAVLRISQ